MEGFSRVVVTLSDNPKYFVEKCQYETELLLDPAPNDLRIWSFVKKGLEGLSIKCNDVLVAELLFAESTNPDCLSSEWVNRKINFIRFDPDLDKTVGIKIKGVLLIK